MSLDHALAPASKRHAASSMILHAPDMSSCIPAAYLDGLANIDSKQDQYGQTYRYIRRAAKPVGLLLHDKIILKVYHLLRENTPLQEGTAENLENFVRGEIDAGHVDLRQGAGFVMLGQGFVSINVWGKGNGLFTQVYTVEADPSRLTRDTLENAAVCCTWDSKIIYFELRRWHEYLRTPMRTEDKRRYLSTFISGELDAPDCPV